MKTKFNIPVIAVQDINKDELKILALYLKLKGRYANSVIYNATIKKISQEFGISPYLMSKYLPILLKEGYVRYQCNHLIISSFTKVFGVEWKNKIQIDITKSISEIMNDIRYGLVVNDYNQQMYMYKLKTHRPKARPRDLQSFKRKWKRYGKSSYEESRSECITSYRRIARLCNVSLSHAHALIDKWKKDGRLSMRENLEYLNREKCGVRIEFQDVGNGFFIKRGHYLMIHHGSVLELL